MTPMSGNGMPTDMPNETPRSLLVCSGSRLHFGLFSFGRSDTPQFGGVGLMLSSPAVVMQFTEASHFEVQATCLDRVARTVDQYMNFAGHEQLPDCRISLVDMPPQHIGLGSGTQLACAVASGLAAWHGQLLTLPEQLAAASGRGKRSAIGTHGFLQGGFIIDGGKHASECVGTLLARQIFPEEWKVLLIWPTNQASDSTVSGDMEQHAFEQMPAVSPERENELREIAVTRMLPAVASGDFNTFSREVFRYNMLAGECYRLVQGGTYANNEVAELIAMLRLWGVEGVGQSSWGPLVFAFTPSQADAEALKHRLAESSVGEAVQCHIASAMNSGAPICAC